MYLEKCACYIQSQPQIQWIPVNQNSINWPSQGTGRGAVLAACVPGNGEFSVGSATAV